MKLVADMHCHTTASTHAYSSVFENICEAKKRGLYALAITDHAENMPGAPGTWYFNNLTAIPKNLDGVNIFRGVEANVLNIKGDLDIPLNLKVPLNWVIASVHDVAFTGKHGIEECTEIWLNVCKNPLVNVIGHSGLISFAYDYEKVIPEFGRNGKLVEINNASFQVRPDSIPNCKRIASLCKKYNVSIIVNSDAHFCTQVGQFDKSIKLLNEIEFPEELIVNSSIELFKNYMEEHTNFFVL